MSLYVLSFKCVMIYFILVKLSLLHVCLEFTLYTKNFTKTAVPNLFIVIQTLSQHKIYREIWSFEIFTKNEK